MPISQEYEPHPLAFDDVKQKAVMGYLLGKNSNDRFFRSAIHALKPEAFKDITLREIWKIAIKWYDNYSTIPTIPELMSSPWVASEEQATKNLYRATLSECYGATASFALEPLRSEMTDWIHKEILREGVLKIANTHNSHTPESLNNAIQLARDMVIRIDGTTFENDYEESMENFENELQDQALEYENALTFGIQEMDELLCPVADKGGLLLGDTTVLLAPVNVGKTTSCVTIAKHNIERLKHVCFVVHEGRSRDIKEKVWRALLECTNSQLYNYYLNTPEGLKEMYRVLAFLKRYFVFIPMMRPGLTVEEVVAAIERADERHFYKTGHHFDLVVDDYPAILDTMKNGHGSMSKREKDDYVYRQFVSLALEHNWHTVLPIQTNRDGYKINVNAKGSDDRLLIMSDVSESFGPMQAATNVITLNRPPIAKARGYITYHIDKSRSNDTGFAVACRSDYSKAITHSNELGCRWYQGESPMYEKIEQYLFGSEGGSGEIPQSEWPL